MDKTKTLPTKWNFKPLFTSDDDPKILEVRNQCEEKIQAFISHWKTNKDYLKDPATLQKAMDEYNDLMHTYGVYGTEQYYFHLRLQQEESNPDLKAKDNTIQSLAQNLGNDLEFFTHTISLIPASKQKAFLEYPGLAPYKHYLELLFGQAKYLLSEPEEKIMNLKQKTSYVNWFVMLGSFLSKEEAEVTGEDGQKTTASFEMLTTLMNSQNKQVRDEAAKAFNHILEKYSDVAEVELNSILENKKIDDDLRHVKRPDETRHVSDDIDTQTVDNLVEVVAAHTKISQDFYELKAKLLKLPKLAYHERNIEYGEFQKKYTYEEGVALVSKVFHQLDEEIGSIFDSFVHNGLIDVYAYKGKHAGAFCAHELLVNPTYILLNYTDQLVDVLTLAHESGHGVNNELIRKTQNALNFATPTSTAEVASTFMEDFVLQELLTQANDELKLSLLMMKLNSDISTIFRQIAAYQFEQALHAEFRKTGYLSKQTIGELFSKYMSSYMGPAVEQSSGAQNWWIYWTHIRYFFYNYSYASGLLISKALQAGVKENPQFIHKVKDFLSAGRSKSPRDIFLSLGIDINDKTFWEKGVKEVDVLLEETETLAKKLKKI